MVLSMTGYGQSIVRSGEKVIKIELRSLNGKSADVRLKVPSLYKSKELEFRNQVLKGAVRGKIDITISFDGAGSEEPYKLNTHLIKNYFLELKELAEQLGVGQQDILSSILKIPNVVELDEADIDEKEFEAVKDGITQVLAKFKEFRAKEGKAMKSDIIFQLESIENLLKSIEPHEGERIKKVKQKLARSLDQISEENKMDQNRYEQEIIYYLEKLDITEEKIRLEQHCKYLREVLDNEEEVKGKKTSFICQEMGREINTIGSKAQYSEIQQIVVNMKDSLEKIKEQVLNIV